MSPQMKIEFFTDEEIEGMKNYIQMQFKNNNKRSEILRRIFPYHCSSPHRWENYWVLQLKGKDFSLENNTVRLKTLKRKGEVYRVIRMHP